MIKNLLIYVNPKGFDKKNERLTKIQIDNSLELGWKIEDILLVTNFPFKYQEVNAKVVDEGYCNFEAASKITALAHLFDIDFIGSGLYWCHDLDAFQLEPITQEELGLENLDAGFCDYGRIPQWQLGSFFFKKEAKDIFSFLAKGINSKIDQYKLHKRKPALDEALLVEMTDNNINNINKRIKRLNGTYDFGMRKIQECYKRANKPLKVVHFDPESKLLNTLAIAMYGRNRIKKPLMNKRLIRIFNKHGYS